MLAGLLFYFAFWGLGQTYVGLSIHILAPFTRSNGGEIYFWLASFLLLFPGTFMIGAAFSPALNPLFNKLNNNLANLNNREKSALLIIIFFCAVIIYRLFHFFILNDYPVTDDEYAAKFGGQLIAGGHLSIPKPPGWLSHPYLYLFERNGQISSFDWPGIQLIWALDILLGTEHLVFAVIAAVAVVVIGYYASINLGNRYIGLAILMTLFSPMFFFLSTTTHAHIISRTAIAIGFLLYSLTFKKESNLIWLLIGFIFGISFFTRAFETAAITTPILIDIGIRLYKKQIKLNIIAMSLLGLIIPLIFFGIFNYIITVTTQTGNK